MKVFPTKRLLAPKSEAISVDVEDILDLKVYLRGVCDLSPSWAKSSDAPNKVFMPQFSALFKPMTSTGENVFAEKNVDSGSGDLSSALNGTAISINRAVKNTTCGSADNSINDTFKNLSSYMVFHVDHPGFLYRQHFKSAFATEPEVAVFVYSAADMTVAKFKKLNAASISALKWSLLYRTRGNTGVAKADFGNNHANNMFPINPGANTYIMVCSSATLFSSSTAATTQSLHFVPSYGSCGADIAALTKVASGKYTPTSGKFTSDAETLKQAFS